MANKQTLKNLYSLKSERTTLQLTSEAYEMLEYLTENYEITQKQMFSVILDNDEILSDVIDLIKKEDIQFKAEKLPKTKVMSKGALDKLNLISKEEGIARDSVLEMSLRYYSKIVKKEKESHVKAKKIIEVALEEVLKKDKELSKLLLDGDPILARWSFVIHTIDYLNDAIENEIEDGTPIDPDDFY